MKTINTYLFLLFLSIIGSFSVSFAQEMPTSSARFVQNKGQWQSFFDYRLALFQGEMLLANDKFIYVLHEPAYMQAVKHHHEKENTYFDGEKFNSHAYQMRFVKANPNVKVTEKQKFPDYQNYYQGNDTKKWVSHVEILGELWYENLYNGIDLNIYGIKEGLKYNFMLQAHANPALIQLQYEGISDISLNKGNLVLKTAFTEVKELAPVAYQFINGRKIEVACQYVLKDNIVSFSFPKGYDKSQALTIDPTIVFSTYSGSTQDNWGYTGTYDNTGNGYAGGIIWSGVAGQTGYPTLGAFQTTYQGGQMDAVITKYNATGSALVFSTYLGGNQEEQPQSLITDEKGNLFVFGRTSSPNFPTISGCYDTTHNGNYDIFVSKFSPTGELLAATFLGGSGDDAVNINPNETVIQDIKYNYADDARGEIRVDDLGDCYLASCTKSTNFPVTSGYFKPTFSGVQDGLVAKLDKDLTTLIWSSFIGGTNSDAAYSLQLDAQKQVYVAGGTMSATFITSSNVLHNSYQGGISDGFVAKISADGTTLIKASYIGTNSYDQCYFVQVDKNNDVYVMGQSNGAYPVVGNVYTTTNARQFITKLDNNLSSMLASTVFGTANATLPNISPTAFSVDECLNVYVAGWGGTLFGYNPNSSGTNGLDVTPNAYDNTTDNQDLYIMSLNQDFQTLRYATFLGGNANEHADGGTSRFDSHGVLYQAVCAGCGGLSTFPTTPGAWSTTNNSSNCNLALMKMDLEISLFPSCFSTDIKAENTTMPFSLSPNPANHTIYLSFGNDFVEKAHISIQNMMGMEVYKADLLPQNGDSYPLSIRNLANGTYFCIVASGGKQYAQKFMVLGN